MLLARSHAPMDQIVIALEINQIYVGTLADNDIAIAALERRAGEHAELSALAPAVDFSGDLAQPRQPVGIGQWLAVTHLFDIGIRMQFVAFLESATERRGQEDRNRGLAGPGYAHDDRDDGLNNAVGQRRRPLALRSIVTFHLCRLFFPPSGCRP